jgi:hypothetical protein
LDFPGRGNKACYHAFYPHSANSNFGLSQSYQYSDLKWNFNHFTGVDWNEEDKKKSIYRILGENKYWAQAVDREHKNYDYLSMPFSLRSHRYLTFDLVGADIEHSHPEARNDIIKWGKWVINETGACGFRFDAVKVRPLPDFLIFSTCLPLISTFLILFIYDAVTKPFILLCSTSTGTSSRISSKPFAVKQTNRRCLRWASSGRTLLMI